MNARFEGLSTKRLQAMQSNALAVIHEAEAGSMEHTPEQIEVARQQSLEVSTQLVNNEKSRLQPVSSQELVESLSVNR